jgi:two-component system, chemotaxis family, chemotaxis protein CheY
MLPPHRADGYQQEKYGMPVDVLIVDDSAAIRKILQRVLTQTRLPLGKVTEAADGREALAAMKQQPVGLILSAINMPNMDGLQLLSALKANDQWKNVNVLVISSGDGSQAKVMEAIQMGARGFVRKPFTAGQFREKLVGML